MRLMSCFKIIAWTSTRIRLKLSQSNYVTWMLIVCWLYVRRHQVIPSEGNLQMRGTLCDGYLFKYCFVKYQTFHQVFEKTSQQTYWHQKTTWKASQMPPRVIKHQLTCPIEFTSGSFLIGGRGILVIPRNHLVRQSKWNVSLSGCRGFYMPELPLPLGRESSFSYLKWKNVSAFSTF